MNLNEYLDSASINYSKNVSLKEKTWLKQGGSAKYWIVPSTAREFVELIKYLKSINKTYILVGNTSNMFFTPQCNVEIVISTLKLKGVQEKEGLYICECGANIAALSKQSVRKGYLGYYGMVNLPGTVGAAVYNNAGCFNCSVLELIEWIELLMPNGEVQKVKSDFLNATYRSTNLKIGESDATILRVALRIEKGASENEVIKADKVTRMRKETQEGPQLNLGSVFSKRILKQTTMHKVLDKSARALNMLRLVKYNKALKMLFLTYYGYSALDKYISDYSLNTFIWRDDKAAKMFDMYQELMSKIYTDLEIEIELVK